MSEADITNIKLEGEDKAKQYLIFAKMRKS